VQQQIPGGVPTNQAGRRPPTDLEPIRNWLSRATRRRPSIATCAGRYFQEQRGQDVPTSPSNGDQPFEMRLPIGFDFYFMLLNYIALTIPNSTPSTLALTMKISLSSVSQMIERLVGLGLAQRIEDPGDRRRKTIKVTAKARTFMVRLMAVRSAEYAAGTASLSETTRRHLTAALSQALQELFD
jgi:DNA-binding MarR family transcriptional regulator